MQWLFSKRGVSVPFVIAVLAVILILSVGGFLYRENGVKNRAEMEQKEEAAGGNMVKPAPSAPTLLAGTSAPLLVFTKAEYDAAIKANKLIVLYFYANWCPICKAEFPKMEQVFNDLTTDRVVGFRVNYNDNETDSDEVALARAFGVAYQHTKVLVKGGTRILKAPDSWDEERYRKEITDALAL